MLVKGLLVTWATTSSATMQLTFFPEYHSFSPRKVNTVLISGALHTLKARFLGPTWGPSVADRTQVGPMLAPWTYLSICSSAVWVYVLEVMRFNIPVYMTFVHDYFFYILSTTDCFYLQIMDAQLGSHHSWDHCYSIILKGIYHH